MFCPFAFFLLTSLNVGLVFGLSLLVCSEKLRPVNVTDITIDLRSKGYVVRDIKNALAKIGYVKIRRQGEDGFLISCFISSTFQG